MTTLPPEATLVLEDGTVFRGDAFAGAPFTVTGEVVFNTAMTGYQEILTDPSYAGQIITFTFPHIGNVGANYEDIETTTPAARGCVVSADITEPSNWRTTQHFDTWLKSHNLVGICGVDPIIYGEMDARAPGPTPSLGFGTQGRGGSMRKRPETTYAKSAS